MPNFLWTSNFILPLFILCHLYFYLYLLILFIRKAFHINRTVKQITVNPLKRNKNSAIFIILS